jgi:pimeloyl-ACP methyl ester carboxylesterase
MPPKERCARIAGIDIAYWDEGSGLPLVFIHGNSLSKRSYSRQFDSPLAREYRLLALDLPGQGGSSHLPAGGTYTVDLFTSIINGCWEGLGCRGGILIGHSLGGHLILQSVPAIRELSGIMIFGTPPLSLPPRMEEAFLPNPAPLAFGFQEEVNQAELDQRDRACFSTAECKAPVFFQDDFRRADKKLRGDLARCVGALAFRDETEVIAALKCPLAILHGEADALCNKRYMEGLTIPTLWQGRIHVIEDASHTPQWEQPRRFNQLLADFAQSIPFTARRPMDGSPRSGQ